MRLRRGCLRGGGRGCLLFEGVGEGEVLFAGGFDGYEESDIRDGIREMHEKEKRKKSCCDPKQG